MDLKQLSNRQLLSRLVTAGPDDPMWPEFVYRFRPLIRRITYSAYTTAAERNPGLDAGLPGEAAEDMTQEVFVRLIHDDRRALADFRGLNDNSIYSYLHTIAINLVRDHFKALRAQKRPPAAASTSEPLRTADGPQEGLTLGDLLPSSAPGPDRAAESRELRKIFLEAVELAAAGVTSKRDRLIFRLYFFESINVEEIASLVGLSVSGVEKRILKIRTAVKKLLGGRED